MPSIYEPYIPLFLLILFSVGLGLAILFLNAKLGPRRGSATKRQHFECGNPPTARTRQRFDVKFYLVGLFFIVFDVEVVFLLPWAVRYKSAIASGEGMLYLGEMLLFLGLLTAGLIYVWKRGALEWD